MNNTENMRKEMFSPDVQEVIKTLGELDENSMVLAGTYMAALADRQKLEKAKLVAAV